MSGTKMEVQWARGSPEKFITWSSEIYLYEAVSRKEIPISKSIKLSDSTMANLLAMSSCHNYIKCVDVYPHPSPDILLAVGQANGKVVLSTFGPTIYDARGLAGKELVPRHGRPCNVVAWNPVDGNLLVTGLDKYRADHSVLVWDISKCPHNGETRTTNSHHHHVSPPTNDTFRPIVEIGLSEATHSLSWFQRDSKNLVIGMSSKHLKIVDLRDFNKTVSSTVTKAVYGLQVDPHNDHQFASFIESQICIWDTRNIEKPLLTMNQPKPIHKLSWCPTRHNLLGSISRDSPSLQLYDIMQTVISNDEVEPSYLERTVLPSAGNNISSFSWSPAHENRLLTVSVSGALTDYVVFERITMNWSSVSNLVWSFGQRTLKYVKESDDIYKSFDDISTKIRRRALKDYGLKSNFWENGELAEDPALKSLWQWLAQSRQLVEQGGFSSEDKRLPGVRCVLNFNGIQANGTSVSKSELISIPRSDSDANNATAKMYRSDERDKALQLCGWNFDKNLTGLMSFLDRLEAEGAYTRAAAIAVFNMNLRLAIDILNRGASALKKGSENSKLNLVAMALAGYSEEKTSMWRELCQSSRPQLIDPYLRATFAFLTSETDSYELVVNENGIVVEDRVAFACLFLSDTKLDEFLKQFTVKLTEEGKLAGFLLTGTTVAGIHLLQRYLDLTGDVQSVSVLALQTFPSQLIDNPTVQEWINSYRNLLDSWRFWNQRAQFDIVLSNNSGGDKTPQQVFVSCNFCGKSISAQMQGHSKAHSPLRLGTTQQKVKLSACPQCRKPLPRCAICLIHMGTPAGLMPTNTDAKEKLTPFSTWFTWCQTCRHGGHASHMTEWFREHLECPVTACSCRCLSLDSACRVGPVTAPK